MRKHLLFASLIFSLLAVQVNAQTHSQLNSEDRVYPEVPRISAYEAYVRFKNGRAIILHAGGEEFRKRHIIGAFNLEGFTENLDAEDSIKGRLFRKLPKQGLEIMTYCY